MLNSELWTELETFRSCEPSELAFRALMGLLDTWPTEEKEKAIGIASELIASWPDSNRIAPWSWCQAASRGHVEPTWSLVRALELTSGHLTKETVDLARIASFASLDQITELEIPSYSKFHELSFLYHRPELFPSLKRLRAKDKFRDADVRILATSSLWEKLERFEMESMKDSFSHKDPCRIVPQLNSKSPIQHLSLRGIDFITLVEATDLPKLKSATFFIRTIEEAERLSLRVELSQLESLTLAFRCGFSGRSPFEPFIGTVIEADEAAAEIFFRNAKLESLQELSICGYPMGYWGREGIGSLGLTSLIESGLLKRLKRLRLEHLPLGDEGVRCLAEDLGTGTEIQSLELVDVYCKGPGAVALSNEDCLRSLRNLDLSSNRIDEDSAALLAFMGMPSLESLDLSGPEINPYYWNVGAQPALDLAAVVASNGWNCQKLKQLKLSNCHLTDRALFAIFHSTKLSQLAHLDLSNNLFTAAGLARGIESPIWQNLNKFRLSNCRLDNDAIEALTKVAAAPQLRALDLSYNSIGPRGAVALAQWRVLQNVWHLNLHDNLIGDEGLVAFSQSPNLGRLLELDLEQDCWNSRAFTFNNAAAEALRVSKAFPRLDCIFSGKVDEYHSTAYSPGFHQEAISELKAASWMRPSVQASLSDFSGIEEFYECREFDENRVLDEHDFRCHPYELNEREATLNDNRLKQLSKPRLPDRDYHELPPPELSPLPELEIETEDVKGLSFRDPIPVTDHSLVLSISLEDGSNLLPPQIGKLLRDTLGSIFRACSLGNFEVSGGSSRPIGNGEYVETGVRFHVSVKGELEPAIQLIREVLHGLGVTKAELDYQPLDLSAGTTSQSVRFLQLAALTIFRWPKGHRIDRVPFTKQQREVIRAAIEKQADSESQNGWIRISTRDGGVVSVYTKYLDDSDNFDALNCLVDKLSPEVAQFVFRIMKAARLILLPIGIAAEAEVEETIDSDWPEIRLLSTPELLYTHLQSKVDN